MKAWRLLQLTIVAVIVMSLLIPSSLINAFAHGYQDKVLGDPPGWSEDINLSNNSTIDEQHSLAVCGNDVHVVWRNVWSGNPSIYYRNSNDTGATWNDRLCIVPISPMLPAFPDIAVSAPNIHLVYRMWESSSWEINYINSTDGGVTWNPSKLISVDDGFNSEAPKIAVSEDGQSVHIVCVDSRHGITQKEIYYKRSIDGGQVWDDALGDTTQDRRLTFGLSDVSYPNIAINGSNIHVTYEDSRDGTADIYYIRSTDNGVTWHGEQKLTSNSTQHAANTIAVDGSTIHVAWVDVAGTTYYIYYTYSTDNGENWSVIQQLSGPSSGIGTVNLAVSGDNVHAVWSDVKDVASSEIYYINSTDGGVSWNPEIILTSDDGQLSNMPKIAVDDSKVHMTWRDNRDGNAEIFYKRYPDFPPTITQNFVASANISQPINITANVTDDVGVVAIYLNYTGVNGTNYNISMNQWDGNWSYDIPAQDTIGYVLYFIWANDTTGNTEMTPIYQIQILDVTRPEIIHNPVASGTTGEPTNITAQITDDVGAYKVFLNYTDVLGTNHNVSMSGWNGNNWSFVIPGHNPTGTVRYFIWCNDTSNNVNMTGEYQFQIYDDDNPIANAGLDQSVNEDDTVYFDGSKSTDNVGIVWSNWTFGDGSYQNGANATPNHTYTNAGNYIVALNVSDAAGNWATDTSFVIVNNVAPIANASGNKIGNEGVAITFNSSASIDTASDNATLNYVWYFGDGNSEAGKIVNHVYADNDIYNATLVITDDNGSTDLDTFTVTVKNLAPSIMLVINQTVTQGVPFTLRINATDVPADILTFSDNTTLFDINPVTGIIQFTPTNGDVGIHFVNITVTDDDMGSSSITFKITVNNTNDAPVIAPIPALSATEDILFTLQMNASDPDAGDNLTYSLTAYPTGMAIASTGLITWTPTNAAVGSHVVTVRVSDSLGLSDEKTFAITVANVNDVPTISTSSLANATEDAMYLYSIQANDVDVGDTLSFSLDSAPSFLSINPSSGLVYWTPANAHVGTHQIVVNVTDGTTHITRTFNLTVINVNDLPTLNYIPPQAAIEDVSFSLQLVGQDVDVGDTLTYSLIFSPSGLTINQATGLIAWTPMNDDVGTHTVIVRVSDASGAFAERSFLITVANVNDPPVIITTAIPNATEDIMYLATIQAEDVDGDVLTFSFDSAPSFLSVDSMTGLIYGMPTNNDVGVHQIVVNVSDGTAFVTKTFNLTVLNVNELSTITSYPITIAKPGSEYAYAVIAEDTDAGDVLTYSLVEAPEGMNIDSQTGKITWTPTETQAGQTYQVVVKVSDGNGSTTQAFSIVVDELPAEPYHPLFDDYVWIGIIILLVMIIMLMLFYRFNKERKEKEPDNINKES